MKYSKRIKLVIIPFIVTLIFSSFCLPIKSSAIVYDYKSKYIMYTTTADDVYTDEVSFGLASQEVGCSFSYSVVVPPDTDYGNITVKGTLQRKTANGEWVNVRTLEAEAQLSNTSEKSYKLVQAYAEGYADLKSGFEYRVKFTVKDYTGTQEIKIIPVYKIDYVFITDE